MVAARLASSDEDPILRKLLDMLMRFICCSISLKSSNESFKALLTVVSQQC